MTALKRIISALVAFLNFLPRVVCVVVHLGHVWEYEESGWYVRCTSCGHSECVR